MASRFGRKKRRAAQLEIDQLQSQLRNARAHLVQSQKDTREAWSEVRRARELAATVLQKEAQKILAREIADAGRALEHAIDDDIARQVRDRMGEIRLRFEERERLDQPFLVFTLQVIPKDHAISFAVSYRDLTGTMGAVEWPT